MIHPDEIALMEHVLRTHMPGDPSATALRSYPMAEKRLYGILIKWASRGLWEYGVSPFVGWIPDVERFKAHHAQCNKGPQCRASR